MSISSLQLYPGAVEFPASNPAVPAVSNNRIVIAFTTAANESIIFPLVMPTTYAGGTLTLVLTCAMLAATTGDVDFDAEVEAVSVGESSTADSFDSVNSTDNTNVPATAGLTFTVNITLTNKDSVAVADQVRIRLTRDKASDTAADTLYLIGAELQET